MPFSGGCVRLFIQPHPHARRHRRHAEQAGNLPDMLGRCAAAAADNPRPRLHTFHDLLGVIRRRAVVIGASFLHMGIACVGHGAHPFIPDVQRRKKLPNVIRPADAVQADGIHRAAGRIICSASALACSPARVNPSASAAKETMIHASGQRMLNDVRRSLRKPFAALHGFKQKARQRQRSNIVRPLRYSMRTALSASVGAGPISANTAASYALARPTEPNRYAARISLF